MTSEERLDRIEHAIAGWIEQSKKENQEDRQLWRVTQVELRELGRQTNTQLQAFQAENRDEWKRLRAEMAARDRVMDKRISDLVSAIGQFIAKAG